MKAPFGKRGKTPEDNADCFLRAIEGFIPEEEGGKPNKKASSKMEKYVSRMGEIMNGKVAK